VHTSEAGGLERHLGISLIYLSKTTLDLSREMKHVMVACISTRRRGEQDDWDASPRIQWRILRIRSNGRVLALSVHYKWVNEVSLFDEITRSLASDRSDELTDDE
jgi:CDP-diacylglycerol pyrophosphatase